MGEFGEKLRTQREQRGLALEAISNTTKISVRMLRALEEEHFDQLPGGVFNKGFVRAYARQIGLDEEQAINGYLAALRENQIQAQQILPDFRLSPVKHAPPAILPENDRRETSLEIPSKQEAPIATAQEKPPASAAGILAIDRNQDRNSSDRRTGDRRKAAREDLSTPAQREINRRPTQENNDELRDEIAASPNFITHGGAGPNRAPVALPPNRPDNDRPQAPRFSLRQIALAVLLITVGLAAWASYRLRSSPKAADASTSGSSGNTSPTSSTPPSLATSSRPTGGATPVVQSSTSAAPETRTSSKAIPANERRVPATTSTAAPARPEPSTHLPAPIQHSAAARPPATFSVLIRADKTSWVQISADGKPVAHETLIAPAHTSIRATREIVVRAGNAAGISFLLNGKEVPAGGNEGEVKTYAFDANGVRVVSPSPAAANP